MTQKTLGAVLFDDFELLDLYGPLEMFGNIGKELRIVTIAETKGPVRSVQGPSTLAEYDFTDAPPLDFVLLPGGLGTFPQSENAAMLEFLTQYKSVDAMMSVCSGSGVLAHAGLLNGRRATSNKLFFSAITEAATDVEWIRGARWVEDGNIFTSSGVSAGTDMSLGVIQKFYGQERAERIAVLAEYEWHREAATDPFAEYIDQGDLTEYLEVLGRA